jgi:acetyl esterase
LNPFKRVFYKIFSSLQPDMTEEYRLVRRLKKAVTPSFPGYRFADLKILVKGREIPVRIFTPQRDPLPQVLLFFHGGGWVIGDIESYTNVCANMANQTRHRVVSVDYRLAPEYPFPQGLEDCYYVWRVLSERPEFMNCMPEDIVLIGDSAGGNLAAAVSLMAAQRGVRIPQTQILLYPATNNNHSEEVLFRSIRENGTDYGLTTKVLQDYMNLYLPRPEDKENPLAAPLLAVDVHNQPRTLVITAEYDPLRDEGTAYAAKLALQGVPAETVCLKGAVHGFISFPKFHEHVVECYRIINRFLGVAPLADDDENGEVSSACEG